MEIKRDAYLQQLIERKDNGMIKVITGIRRCGKSFLLFTIFKRYLLENGVDVDHIIEIALDGIENEELSLYITKRSETVLQWGKRKNIKKLMINGELVIEWKKEKMHKGCSCGEYLL